MEQDKAKQQVTEDATRMHEQLLKPVIGKPKEQEARAQENEKPRCLTALRPIVIVVDVEELWLQLRVQQVVRIVHYCFDTVAV